MVTNKQKEYYDNVLVPFISSENSNFEKQGLQIRYLPHRLVREVYDDGSIGILTSEPDWDPNTTFQICVGFINFKYVFAGDIVTYTKEDGTKVAGTVLGRVVFDGCNPYLAIKFEEEFDELVLLDFNNPNLEIVDACA